MKKTILLCSLLGLLSGYSFSQVGINTENPQGPFHVDGQGDNGTIVPPTATATANDFIVDFEGKVGIGTISPQAKVDIHVSGGNGFRMNDGTADKGEIIVSDADGNMSWGVRPEPEQKIGSIIQNSTSTGATSTTAPNLMGRNTSIGSAPNNAVQLSTGPLILEEGTWLVQVKYTTRKTNGTGSGGLNFNTCLNDPDNVQYSPFYYVWTMLYDESNSEVLTSVGTSQEISGFCLSTPQVNHIVKVDAGSTRSINVYGSTSVQRNVIVYVDGDITQTINGETVEFRYGEPYFRAVRLDAFKQ